MEESYFVQRRKYFREAVKNHLLYGLFFDYQRPSYHDSLSWFIAYDRLDQDFNENWRRSSYYERLRFTKNLPAKPWENRFTTSHEYVIGQIFGDSGYWKLVAEFKKRKTHE